MEVDSAAVTAVLCAQAVGFDRLQSIDASAADRTFATSCELIERNANATSGGVVEASDAEILAGFARVEDAVSAALEIQTALEHRNALLSTESRLFFRVGVGVGRAQADGQAPDGVETARRVCSLADPGGVCVSGKTFEALEGRYSADFEDLGLQAVRNLPRPVRVFRVVASENPKAGEE